MTQNHIAIVPQPQSITPGEGVFVINTNTRIQADQVASSVADYLARFLKTATGFQLPVSPADGSAPNRMLLTTMDADPSLGDEGYTLHVTPESVEIRAARAAGLFYGVQTLRQLLPAGKGAGTEWTAPAVAISDAPQYRWRGLHLDVGRHFFPVAFIKKFLDVMALHKFNVFHWHLTEDQGWRIEIKQYPKLTEIGSKRTASPFPADRTRLDNTPYGGYYTQAEIRDVVAYAQERFITVVPEIEMPGHAVAALASYPEYGCIGKGYTVRTYWGIADDVFCAGNEMTYTFLENILDEVFDLFPSEYIHIGGDECPKTRWKSCPKCQQKIKDEGLADEHALQSYFIRRMERYLNAKGRRLIGWDEILEGGLAPNATVMSWRGTKGGIEAAIAGHDVVMTPNTYCYLDYYQSEDRESEPPAIGGYISLEKAFAFNPVEGIPDDKTRHVIGGQGNIWTEYMPTEEQVEYMAYPRAVALAEAMWTASPGRDYAEFLVRLRSHLPRLDQMGVRYRNPSELRR